MRPFGFQISLRWFIIAATGVAFVGAMLLNSMLRDGALNSEINAQVKKMGGTVSYTIDVPSFKRDHAILGAVAAIVGRDYVAHIRCIELPFRDNPASLSATLKKAELMSTLTDLFLDGSMLDEQCIEDIGRLRSLESLSIVGVSILSLSPVARLPKLHTLTLNSSEGLTVSVMRELSQSPYLAVLDCSYSDINDDSLEGIAGFASLQELDLTCTDVTVRGLSALAKLPRLIVVGIDRRIANDAGGVESLTRILPRVKIDVN